MMSLFGVTEQGFSQIKIGAKPEIWATACAIPTCSTSTSAGDLFIADVGQNHWEEINYQPASSKGGEVWLEGNQASSAIPTGDPAKAAQSSASFPWASIRTRSPIRARRN